MSDKKNRFSHLASTGKHEEVDVPQKEAQRGRRADPLMRQVNANIPSDLQHRFKIQLAVTQRTMQEVLEELITDWVETTEAGK